MPVTDLRTLPTDSSCEVDICIVGAGAAGLTLAGSPKLSGRKICVLEAGGMAPDEESQALYDLENVGFPVRENYMARARYFGGTCNLWAGRCMKLARNDVDGRPWLGSGGAAWPISYAELGRYYDRAAKVLRLPNEGTEQSEDTLSGDEAALLDGGKFLPNMALWAKKPARFGKQYRKLFKGADYSLFLNASATEIVLDDSGRHVESVVAKSLTGQTIRVKARRFVLAAGGLENARLLLISRRTLSNGIGNEHDLVGRYYMDHPRAVFGRVRLDKPANLTTVLGIPVADGKVQLGLGLSDELQREYGVVNSYLSLEPLLSNIAEARYRTSISIAKVVLRRGHAGGRLDWSAMKLGDIKDMIYLLTPKEILPHSVYRALLLLKNRLYGNLSRGQLTIINYCEQLARRDSRAFLSSERDVLDTNKLVLDWKVGDEVGASLEAMHRALDEQLRRKGIGAVDSLSEDVGTAEFTDASHHMGTTRMSNDPRQGVVDSNCRVHGVDNLYVNGSSVFPTCGNANPTWTIVALALRLADHLEAS